MKNILQWFWEHILFICTLFLLVFIPLYPKLPLLDVQNTWVYIRVEDVLVAGVFFIWGFLLFRKKVSLETPLTFPILLFWIIGGIATLHGVLLLFSTLEGVHANVAFLSYLRRIEYMSLFFIAYAAIKEKRDIYFVIGTLVITLFFVEIYGLGQRFLGFPAFLTMNEEVAKGTPIYLSALSRISSTFAGHYDLAAYLVLLLPLMASLFFGFKNIFIKLIFALSVFLGLIVLFMTVSRVSFFVLILSLGIVLLFQKRKLAIISLGVLILVVIPLSPRLMERFASTVSETDVLVDAGTGIAIGPVKEVPQKYFENTVITIKNPNQESRLATITAILSPARIPPYAALVVEPNSPTGEDLPQGTSYINLSLSPAKKKETMYFFEKSQDGTKKEANVYFGNYIIKKAKAYDLSFTTRFQGEWPRTIEAFEKNIFLGSGYGSVSLAVDNNYLRILGESGLFGLLSFLSIFIFGGIYIKKVLPKIASPVMRSFILGFAAGSFGLALNAILIDVFEASKIAFTYWLLMGIIIGVSHLYKTEHIDIWKSCKYALSSSYAIGIYIFVTTMWLFSSLYNNYFIGLDFMWLRLASRCYNGSIWSSVSNCPISISNVVGNFFNSDTAFYRPATLLYFYLMHKLFWLNQTMYHFVSILLYFSTVLLVFLIAKKIFKNSFLGVITAGTFLILVGHTEVVFWIASTDILFGACFALLSLLCFIYWEENHRLLFLSISLIAAIICPFFQVSGIMLPFILVLYDFLFGKKIFFDSKINTKYILLYSLAIFAYLFFGFLVHSLSFPSLSYWISLLRESAIQIVGYVFFILVGPASFSVVEKLQHFNHSLLFSLLFTGGLCVGIFGTHRLLKKNMHVDKRNIVFFGFAFFLIALIPFLGIGIILSSSSYLPSVGLAFLIAFGFNVFYDYLRQNNDIWTSRAIMMIVVMLFCMVQLFQLQAIQERWVTASTKSERFFISFNQHYANEWSQGIWKFYFVNLQELHEDAWIFSNGLSDAVWFVTQNTHISVLLNTSLSQALDIADVTPHARIFEFQKDGGVKEVTRRTINGKTKIIKL